VAKGYRPVDRDQQFLLPPDMRQWLPAGHVVWALISVVKLLDTSAFHERCRLGGVGRAGYDPDMMLTLLLYAYASGERSSRKIERLCWQDVAFRVICAQDVPDHTTIWRFADAASDLVEQLFAEVLALCAKSGMIKLGTITLDGMKIGANASMKANRSEEQIRAELAKIAATAVAEHRATDAAEQSLFGDGTGELLPAELADPRSREARLRQALAELTAERAAEQAKQQATAKQYLDKLGQGPVVGRAPMVAQLEAATRRLAQAITAQQTKIDEWERRRAEAIGEARNRLGPRPRPVEEHARVIRARAAVAQAEAAVARWQARQQPDIRNATDPDSRIMPTKSGFIQGYNAQNVVSEDGFIIATELTQDTGDTEQAIPMMAAAERAASLVTDIHSGLAEAAGEQCLCREAAPPGDGESAPPVASPQCPLHRAGIGTIVMDAGYHSADNLAAEGPDRLIAPGKRRDVEREARQAGTIPTPTDSTDADSADAEHAEPERAEPNDHDPEQTGAAASPPPSNPPPSDPVKRNAERLRTPEGIATYRRRGHIAETPHGHIKANRGIRTLTRRGKIRAAAEWKLVCATFNLDRLIRILTTTGQPLTSTT
jgi:transposase